jgi:hypothetical protein
MFIITCRNYKILHQKTEQYLKKEQRRMFHLYNHTIKFYTHLSQSILERDIEEEYILHKLMSNTIIWSSKKPMYNTDKEQRRMFHLYNHISSMNAA